MPLRLIYLQYFMVFFKKIMRAWGSVNGNVMAVIAGKKNQIIVECNDRVSGLSCEG